MFYQFQRLPTHARVWVYQSDQALTTIQVSVLNDRLKAFCVDWTAHNNNLMASFEVKDDYFVAIAVDESGAAASGCSVDKMVRLMQALGQELGVNFFDRLRTVTISANGQRQSLTLSEFQKAIKAGGLVPSDMVYDNLVTNLGQYRDQHQKPLYQTWLAKYFGQEQLAEI